MDKINKQAKGQDAIPAQQVEKIYKEILHEIRNLRKDTAAKDQLLARYAAEPLKVVPVDDIDKVIRVDVQAPEGYLGDVEQIRDSLQAIRALYGALSRERDQYKSLAEEYKARIEAPAPTGWTMVRCTLERLFCRDNVMKGTFCFLLASGLLFLAASCYTVRWSDDAWARRAYDAAMLSQDIRNPGLYYQNVRKLFQEERRNAAKGAVLDFEASVRKEIAEKDTHDKANR